jgi:hypothetical protein
MHWSSNISIEENALQSVCECDCQADGEPKPVKASGGHKEKSVLQAKLTKLAIQIGYVGT